MALQVLPAFPKAVAHRYSVTLDGNRVTVFMRWNNRTLAWYMGLEQDGVTYLQGRRVTPGTIVDLAALGLDVPGLLFFSGSDPYRQDDLGGALSVLYLDEESTALFETARALPADLVS